MLDISLQLNGQEIRSIAFLLKDICNENLPKLNDSSVSLVIDYVLEESFKQTDMSFHAADILTTLAPKYYIDVRSSSSYKIFIYGNFFEDMISILYFVLDI